MGALVFAGPAVVPPLTGRLYCAMQSGFQHHTPQFNIISTKLTVLRGYSAKLDDFAPPVRTGELPYRHSTPTLRSKAAYSFGTMSLTVSKSEPAPRAIARSTRQ